MKSFSHSLRFRFIFFLTISFLAMSVIVLLLSYGEFRKIADSNQEALFNEKIERILKTIEVKYERLQMTGQVEAYVEDFKDSVLNELKNVQYISRNEGYTMFIVNSKGLIELHPTLKRGDDSLKNTEYINQIRASEGGEMTLNDSLLSSRWFIYKRFDPWGWSVVYEMPLTEKYKGVSSFLGRLAMILIGTIFLVLSILLIAVIKILKPVRTLTEASEAMVRGDMDYTIPVKGQDELSNLSRFFLEMRETIDEKIQFLSRMTEIIEQTSDLVCMISSDMKMLYLNREGRKMIGIGFDEDISERTIGEFIAGPGNSDVLAKYTIAAEKGLWMGEAVIHGADGKELSVSQVIVCHRSQRGTIDYYSTIIRDLSEQIRKERDLMELRISMTSIIDSMPSLLVGVDSKLK